MQDLLAGCSILIVEDEPLIALDIKQAFEDQGAAVTVARTLSQAMTCTEDPFLSAAVLDHALGDGDSTRICERLKERNIPFVTFSGYDHLEGACGQGVHVRKPASASTLVATVRGLIWPQPMPTT